MWPDPRATARGSHRDPRHAQVAARRLPTDTGLRFDSAQRPSQSPQRHNLLSLSWLKTLAIPAANQGSVAFVNVSECFYWWPAFYVSICGPFWVPTEVIGHKKAGANLAGLYSLTATCEANGVEPISYLTDVLGRVGSQPAASLDDLLPHTWRHSG